MRKLVKAVVVGFMACYVFAFPAQAAEELGFSDYEIGTGDMLSIRVFGEDNLDIDARLSDAGTISYPFLGEIKVKGMRIGELSNYIQRRLADGYLVDPSVHVSVLEYRKFFINGEVENPGGYPYQPGLTLQKAVALAGGFTERASRSKLSILSDEDDSSPNDDIDLNTEIKPGDIVTVEESFF